jgi:hypothetical protein
VLDADKAGAVAEGIGADAIAEGAIAADGPGGGGLGAGAFEQPSARRKVASDERGLI